MTSVVMVGIVYCIYLFIYLSNGKLLKVAVISSNFRLQVSHSSELLASCPMSHYLNSLIH